MSITDKKRRLRIVRDRLLKSNIWRSVEYIKRNIMPTIPPKPCHKAGCGRLTYASHCETHIEEAREQNTKDTRQRWQGIEKNRPSAYARGYTGEWRKARMYYLKRHPTCTHCRSEGVLTMSQVVDHIEPHKGDMALFWDEDNWQSLCVPCHNIKSAREGREAQSNAQNTQKI